MRWEWWGSSIVVGFAVGWWLMRRLYWRGWCDAVAYVRERARSSPVVTCQHCGQQQVVAETSMLRDLSDLSERDMQATIREWEKGNF